MSALGETAIDQVVAVIGLMFFTALALYLLSYGLYIAFWTVVLTVQDAVAEYTSRRRRRKANKQYLEMREARARRERVEAMEKELGITTTHQEETPQ